MVRQLPVIFIDKDNVITTRQQCRLDGDHPVIIAVDQRIHAFTVFGAADHQTVTNSYIR